MSSASIARVAVQTPPQVRSFEGALRIFLGCAPDDPLTIEDALLAKGTALPDVVISWTQAPDTMMGLASQGHSHLYRLAVLPSRSQPRWILPHAGGRRGIDGFQFYMPYSRVARLVKALVVEMRATGWQGWVRDSVLIASRKPLPIESLAREATGEEEIVFALSLGTPGTFQKLTVQVMRKDGSILGYVKMPLTDGAEQRLKHEAEVVRQLHRYSGLRPHIPTLLFAGRWNRTFVVFQSPLPGGMGPARFTDIHEGFLQVLQSCQPSRLPGESLIQGTARKWEHAARFLGARWHSLGRETLKIASRELGGSKILSGLHHGDFAPWNTRADREHLYVFDWESAEYDAPILWDQFHFLAQTECVLKEKQENRDYMDVRTQNHALYLLYLLSSAAQAAQEGAKQFAIDYREKQILRQLSEFAPANA
jgi:hypothetical protein